MKQNNHNEPYLLLKSKIESYTPITDSTWQQLQSFSQLLTIPAQTTLYPAGQHLTSFAFVCAGLFRAYITDNEGDDITKISSTKDAPRIHDRTDYRHYLY